MNRFKIAISLYPPEPVPQDESSLSDGSTRAAEGTGDWEERHRLHLLQSNHASMLINNVILRDDKYILSLSKQDIESLGITKEEMQFVNEYIDSLNIGVHEKD